MPSARYPYRPGEPDTPGPPPEFEQAAPWLQDRLFDRRIVLLGGTLTAATAAQTAAALVTLDTLADDPIQVHLSAPDGDLSAAFAVVDAIDSIGSPVHVVVPGTAGGAAIAVLAAADRRIAYRHARIRLAEPRSSVAPGTADQVAAAAGAYLRDLEELIVRLADVTGAPRSRIESDLSAGRWLDAAEALSYGLVDEIAPKGSGSSTS